MWFYLFHTQRHAQVYEWNVNPWSPQTGYVVYRKCPLCHTICNLYVNPYVVLINSNRSYIYSIYSMYILSKETYINKTLLVVCFTVLSFLTLPFRSCPSFTNMTSSLPSRSLRSTNSSGMALRDWWLHSKGAVMPNEMWQLKGNTASADGAKIKTEGPLYLAFICHTV